MNFDTLTVHHTIKYLLPHPAVFTRQGLKICKHSNFFIFFFKCHIEKSTTLRVSTQKLTVNIDRMT